MFVAESGDAHHIDLGGYKADGSDAVNELSYMFLEGMMHSRLNEPNLGVLVHGKTPDKFLIKACELASLGFGQPMFLNADVFVENILARGTLGGPPVPLELARMSCAIGCNEPHITNYESEYQTGGTLRMPAALLLALSDGWNTNKQLQLGLKTGDPRTFASFEELQEAFRKQLSYLVKMCTVAININELILADVYPTAYQSALIEDCIEKGIPREEGGARFNFGPCIATIGVVDVANSLAAIKKLVFEEKTVSMDQLLAGLAANFKNDDLLRQKLLAVPKFGNNDDYVDDLAVWVMKIFCEEVASQKNTRGGHMMPYQNPLGLYVPYGSLTPAMPSGRKVGEPLSDGISPTIGSDVSGPTAVIQSVGKIDTIRLYHGQSLNMRLDSSVFREKAGIGRFVALIRTFLDQKIHHIQLNLVSMKFVRVPPGKTEITDPVVRAVDIAPILHNFGKSSDKLPLGRSMGDKNVINREEMDSMYGLVANIEPFAIYDGPGIRTVVFMKGCPLRCIWCSSPHTQNGVMEVLNDTEKCRKCGACIEVFPKKAVQSSEEDVIRIDRKLCDGCGLCAENCAYQALEMSGKRYTVEGLFHEIGTSFAGGPTAA